jgi:hypothetical protein
MADASTHLDEIVGWGIVHDIFEAEEASAILSLVGQYAIAINKATFGAYFGSLQRTLGRSLILAVARMYETEKGYALRSIPAALKHLRRHCKDLKINDRSAIFLAVRNLGYDDSSLYDAPDPTLTLTAADTFSTRFLGLQAVAGTTVKTIRDKTIAHHEFVDAGALPKTTYAEIDELVQFAKDFVAMVGHAYTSVVYSGDDGQYFLTSDAERSTLCLKRLLRAAGVSLTSTGSSSKP